MMQNKQVWRVPANVGIIVLAAGKGTRMKGLKSKVLRIIEGKPIIGWTCRLIDELKPELAVFVLSYKALQVKKAIETSSTRTNIVFTIQDIVEGTGAATMLGLRLMPQKIATVLVLTGDDSALYRPVTLKSLIEFHLKENNYSTFLTTSYKRPLGVGGLERDRQGNVVGVLTKDELIKQKVSPTEVVCGAFCFNRNWLDKNIKLLKKGKTGEYPLPGLIQIGASKREYVRTFQLPDKNEWNSVNTQVELACARRKKKILLNL